MNVSGSLTSAHVIEILEDNHWWFATRTWAIETWLGKATMRRDWNILDIGCGAGNMIHHLQEFGRVKGIEVDARPVQMARARGYDVQQADATRRIPFADNTFDLVTALDVIEHVDDDGALMRESQRVLKPNGHLLITTPAFQFLWSHNDTLNAHKRRYSAGDLKKRVEASGLSVKRISYNFFLVFPLAATMILLRERLGRKPELSSHHFEEQAYQVEMEPTAPVVNKILRGVGRAEAALIGAVNLPFGTSLICLAVKSTP